MSKIGRFALMFAVVFSIMMLSAMAAAQTTPPPVHTATLLWTAPADATSAGLITVYRGTGDCSTNPQMSPLQSMVATTVTYVDPITPGIYCYYTIHTENKLDSVPSGSGVALLHPNAPSGFTVTVK